MKKITLLLASLVLLAACGRGEVVATAETELTTSVSTENATEPVTPETTAVPAAVKPTLSIVDALVVQGFKFVLVATKNNTDLVLVDEDAHNLEFNVGETVCRVKILTKEDLTYPGEELGVLQVVCNSHGVKLTSSASCSDRYSDEQSHLEVSDDQDTYILDLICRKTTP